MAVPPRALWPCRTPLLIGVTVVAAVTLASCNSTGDSAPAGKDVTRPPGSSTARSAAPTAPADAARRAAIAAYLGMWQDMAAAGRTSDWKSPLLAHHATGDALSTISRGLYADHLNGLVSKGAPKDHPTATSAVPTDSPTTVMISDCGDSTHWLKYRKDTGKLADADPGGRQAITAEVKRQPGGTWKVTRFAVEAVGSC